jgi:hypothetical protein
VRYIEDLMKQMGQQWVPNSFQFHTLKRRVAMLGSDGMTWEDFDYDPGTMVPAGIPAEEHWKAFTFMMQPGSLLKSTRESGYPKAFAMRRQGDMDLKNFLESIDMGNMYDSIVKGLETEGANVLMQAVKSKMAASGGGGGLSPGTLQKLSMANTEKSGQAAPVQ